MVLDIFLSVIIITVVTVGGTILTSIICGIVYRAFRELFKNLW